MSDCGSHALTVIAFVGSVFSPYYAWARRKGASADPENHCAVNVALYGKGGKRWAMTERGKAAVTRDDEHFIVGPSALHWDEEGLTIHIDEVGMPLPFQLKGTVRLTPGIITRDIYELDAKGRHSWSPIAPRAEVEVNLEHPGLSWRGHGYFDTNWGTEPLEDAFVRWDWSRVTTTDGVELLYDVTRKDGSDHVLSISIDESGNAISRSEGERRALAPTGIWRIGRAMRLAPSQRAPSIMTLEDTPFYARSLVRTHRGDEGVHESLDLTRFTRPIVQAMLPFRMPRRG